MVAIAVCFAFPACPKINPFIENILHTVVLLGKFGIYKMWPHGHHTNIHTVKRGSSILTVYSVDRGVGRRQHEEEAEAEHKRNTFQFLKPFKLFHTVNPNISVASHPPLLAHCIVYLL